MGRLIAISIQPASSTKIQDGLAQCHSMVERRCVGRNGVHSKQAVLHWIDEEFDACLVREGVDWYGGHVVGAFKPAHYHMTAGDYVKLGGSRVIFLFDRPLESNCFEFRRRPVVDVDAWEDVVDWCDCFRLKAGE